MSSLFEIPIHKLKGVGKSRAELFVKLGVKSVGDLIRYYPRAYEDWSKPVSIADAQNGEVCCIRATVASPVTEGYTRNSKYFVRFTAYDETSAIKITFFNNRFISDKIKRDEQYYFYGKITKDNFGIQMISPTLTHVSNSQTVHPIYNLTAGLSNKIIEGCVRQALSMLPDVIKDPLPEFIRQEYSLCDLRFALQNIHQPNSTEDVKKARHRLVFEELLILNLGLRNLKNKRRSETAVKVTKSFSDEFEKLLPFKLTNAQKRAINDCINDVMNKKTSMNRLVQGDVGSGKTAVAASVCYTMVKNGYQCAFMVPTEILATQHYNSFCELFKNCNISVSLLTGSATATEKRRIRQSLASGETDIVIGTHALITEDTEFKNLGIAITDEQHRFGVAQRGALLCKGENPHLLVMSATPIPRTLGLIIYGDLDISIIDELPPGRKAVATYLIDAGKRHRAYSFIKNELKKGNCCYIICPLVEEGELPLAAAEEYAAELMLDEFSDYPVGLLHGKMKSKDKESVMQKFADGEISLLVATTVVEVGVDVKNATVIMIENAERFGLSQLHQLRGRVGRGQEQSYCILLSDSKSEDTLKRLSVMCRTNSGFEIADEDLKLRGPGDFFGSRQHGLPTLSIADLSDMQSVAVSQQAAEEIIRISPDLSDERLKGIRAEIRRLMSKAGENTLN